MSMSFTQLLSANSIQLKYGPAPMQAAYGPGPFPQPAYGIPTNPSMTPAVQHIQQTITSIISQPLYAGMVVVFFSIGIVASAFKLYESFRYPSKR